MAANWGWDPVETWAFITWVIYAAYLHARATAGWRGARAHYIQLLGFGQPDHQHARRAGVHHRHALLRRGERLISWAFTAKS